MHLKISYQKIISLLFFFCLVVTINAQTKSWKSSVVGDEIICQINNPSVQLTDFMGRCITVIYLENLGFEKIGTNSNNADVNWLLEQGYRVIELDYIGHENAISPKINEDIVAINDAVKSGSFCGLSNCSQYQTYVLFEGYRIKRNVAYFLDDPTVYNKPSQYTKGDSLYMDIVYPANADKKVPVILSFSYSNSYATYDGNKQKLTDANKHLRLHLGYTLAGFNDSFLEGAPATEMAWAIADHPKYCPWGSGKPVGGTNDTYKSYQANPDAGQKVKSAVRTLRSMSDALGLSGEIGIYGFSRGSDAGSMAIGDKADPIYDNAGLHQDVSDDVQAAVLGPGVFDFTQIYNTLNDGDDNLELRCPWAWGSLDANYDEWKTKGAAYLVETSKTAPVLFFYNTDDSHYYQDQIAYLKAKLKSLRVPVDSIVNHGTGHSVPQSAEYLQKMYDFLAKYLNDTTQTGFYEIKEINNHLNKIHLEVFPNPVDTNFQLQFTLSEPIELNIEVCNMAGSVIFRTTKNYLVPGHIIESIPFSSSEIPNGMYNIRVLSDKYYGNVNFLKSNG